MYNIYIWGTGYYYQTFKNRFSDCTILGLVDSNTEKQGKYLDGHVILSPDAIKEPYDYIVILIEKFHPVKDQLLCRGVPEDKILTTSDWERFTSFRKIKKTIFDEGEKEFLLISHDSDYSGAPLVLLNMARILKQCGHRVDYGVPQYGELCDLLISEHINVIVYDNYDFTELELKKYMEGYKLIVINTIVLWNLVSSIHFSNIKVLWWLHEEEKAYPELEIDRSKLVIDGNVTVAAVGARARNAFEDFTNHRYNCNILTYGIEDKPIVKLEHDRCIIVVIGPVNNTKGQDILIELMNSMDKEILDEFELWFVGYISEDDRALFEKYDNIRIFGKVKHEEIDRLYEMIDVVLSTSRHDTLPVTLVEWMMHKCVCVTSKGTGIADYITQYKDGIIYDRDNLKELSDTVEWIVNHREAWAAMGENAYQLYQNNFTTSVFQDNINKCVDDLFAID